MSKLGTYESPTSQTTLLDMPHGTTEQQIVALIEEGGFLMRPIGDAWGTDALSWRPFYCGRDQGIVAVSVGIMQTTMSLPISMCTPAGRFSGTYSGRAMPSFASK